jgi:hypothetical protein
MILMITALRITGPRALTNTRSPGLVAPLITQWAH